MQETGNIAQLFALVVGVVYLALGLIGFAFTGFEGIVTNGADNLLGFLNELQILSINDELDADNFLHLFSGIAALAVGIIGANQSSAHMARA